MPPRGDIGRDPGGGLRVVGVDGCSGGWVAVALRDGAFEAAYAAGGIAEILARREPVAVFGIDIPIGLEPGRFRRVDAVARRRLGPRGSTLFETPPREVLAHEDFGAALALCRRLTGRGFSKQSHALRGRILEVEPLAEADPRLVEVHPELSFQAMAEGGALPRKRSWNGVRARMGLLERAGIRLPRDLGPPGLEAAVDDVLDAAAAAWTAHRVARGGAGRLEPVVRSPGGREITIWT